MHTATTMGQVPLSPLHKGLAFSNYKPAQSFPPTDAFFFCQIFGQSNLENKITNVYLVEDLGNYFHRLYSLGTLGWGFSIVKIKIYTLSVLVVTD